MTLDRRPTRLRKRFELALPTRVISRESHDHEWMEVTHLMDVSPFGARFLISRPTEVGRLLQLSLPMPRQLRCYDYSDEQYRIWALVRYINTHPSDAKRGTSYEVGVAFIGKRPPASFQEDPALRYDVEHNPTLGLWKVRESPENEIQGTQRPDSRFNVPIELVVEIFNEEGTVAMHEKTVTENINRRGAAVFTTLPIERGRFVRLTSSQYQISVIAVVRARRHGKDGMTRLHLEFVDKQWPLEGIDG